MLFHVSRTCTEKTDPATAESQSQPIAHFRGRAAYVLLGEPGAGKTSLFEAEANNTADGLCISARNFIALNREQWRDKTLFIDGLDEARAGNSNAKTPLDAIRGKLDQLGCKRFRISCRAADWLGATDTKDVKAVSPDQNITVLHLDPLDSDDINQILSNDPRVPDPNGFIEKAGQFGVSGLLNNPQTLDMLITVVSGGGAWPTSKQEVYDVACKQLASEFNENHAPTQTATIPQLLDAAGFLCAIQIIGNVTGLTENQDLEGRLCLKEITAPNGLPLHAALKTRLFNRPDTTEYSYIHRSVAEYLAARYLAKRIQEGLLLTRVLALTKGFDGGIVAALRGLMAWLGVLSPAAREWLIAVDPMGIVVYGDTQQFSTTNKIALLAALKREAESTGYLRHESPAQAFANLITKDMVHHILALITDPLRSKPTQSVINCLLDGLRNCEPIPELKPALMAAVRDSSYWEGIRVGALQAILHQYPDDSVSLIELADDICQNKISDNNRLLGLLLNQLFPTSIPVSKILQYFKPTRGELTYTYSYYEIFWSEKFNERLSDEDLPIILSELAKLGNKFLVTEQYQHMLLSTAGTLLVRGLQVHGENTPLEKLYNWLSIGLDEFIDKLKPENIKQIADWLTNHPTIYFGLLGVGISLIQNSDNTNGETIKIFDRFRNATPPDTLGLWWLEQIPFSQNHNLSCEFFRQAFWALVNGRGHYGLSLEFFQNWLVTHPEFNETYQSLIVTPIENWLFEHAKSDNKWKKQRDDELKKRLKYFIGQKYEIAEGSAYPETYHYLAAAYFGHYFESLGKTGEARLSDYLNADNELVEAANNGLSKIIYRTDLPEVDDIIRLPYLVCIEKLYQENPSALANLADNLVSKALAFWYTYGAGDEPDWVKPLSLLNENVTAQVFIPYVSAMLAGKQQHITGLYQLVHDDEYQIISRQVLIPLLEKYPVRGTSQQAVHLGHLLKAAIKYIPKNQLQPLIEKKLAHKGMDIAQRVYWLTTGLNIEPVAYLTPLRKLINGNTARINHLSAFLCPGWPIKGDNYELSVSVMGMLIEVFGPRCSPYRKTKVHRVGQAENEREYVYHLLNQLGNAPGEEGATILAELLSQPNLSAWHNPIQVAQQSQRLNRREALFKHPRAAQVINTLGNQKPANVADLSALAMDCLEQLAKEMHGSNTDSYKHCWNVDGYNRPLKPKPENGCRNYLLERLKTILAKYDVQIDLEAHQANNKRTDMKPSFTEKGKTYHLPIEIKCDYNGDLWKTIHNQLIPLYTIAPETEDRGLFLVLWFNHENLPTHPQGLPLPTSPEQLAAMLKETMTPQEQKLIEVFVLDVSKR